MQGAGKPSVYIAHFHSRGWRLRHFLVTAVALSLLPGCHGESGTPGSDEGPFPGMPALRLDCTTVSPGPDDPATVDTGATPRADADAEILALETSAEFVAPEPLYQRIAAELAGIRAGFPELASIGVFPCHPADSVLLMFTNEGLAQVQDGTYTAWDDLNANLRLRSVQVFPRAQPPSPVALHFEGRYNVNRLAEAYAGLPEVDSAVPNGFVGDGSDICLARRGPQHFYIFREAHGDCPSGCIGEFFTAVSVDGNGNMTKIGEWDRAGSAPGWFEEALDCREFLAGNTP